ncbi:Lipopolysaccharide-induced tumor necrosis factor-alpha factor -like protein [Halotydeus destructor]|nr:Lipopolysaccharide-induced tumor necrosis factor-alpha factor -like protein [Halotydeus destructor]
MQAPLVGHPMHSNPNIVLGTQGPYPYPTHCSNCGTQVVSRTDGAIGAVTWVSAFVVSAIGGIFCCLCFVPFCLDVCKDVEHRCPSCNMYFGTHKRMC